MLDRLRLAWVLAVLMTEPAWCPWIGCGQAWAIDRTGNRPASTQELPAAVPYVDARAFGAVEDGLTDDTAALQRAVEVVGAMPDASGVPAGGGTIWLAKPTLVCGLVVNRSNITFAGPNPEAAWFQPSSSACPAMISVGQRDAPHGVTDIHFHDIGLIQPKVGAQTGGVMLAWEAATFSGIDNFFVRNAYDVFDFSDQASSITVSRGNIRTVDHDMVTIDGGNDHYFDHIVFDYDNVGPDGALGHGHSCFAIKASSGSIVISDSDFIHCGIGLDVKPRNGNGVEWLFVNNTAFDTCTSDGKGDAIKINPMGADRDGHSSYVHGGKFTNSWGAGCQHGLLIGSDKLGFTEAMAFDNFTVQGNSHEGILLGGNVRAMSFVNLQAYRNSAESSGRYAQVRLAGTGGVGNASFIGGKIGDITDTPVHGADHKFSRGASSIDVDAGWKATLSIIGVDLCAERGGGGIRLDGKYLSAPAASAEHISLLGNACSP